MITLSEETKASLVQKAFEMLNFSYVPYSRFAVGAALLTQQDEIYTGCNIENVAFGPSICAERTAFSKAVSEGKMKFKAIAVVGGPNRSVSDYCSPCGVCRQVMREFCDDDFILILAKSKTEYKCYTLSEILPVSFKPAGQVGSEQTHS